MARRPSTSAEIARLLDEKGVDRRPRRSSSTATARTTPRPSQTGCVELGHQRRPHPTRPGAPPGRRTTPAASSACRSYDKLVHIDWLREVLAGEQPGGRAGRARSCSSTSTSGSPRSTPRATSRAPSTSTRTGSRTRPTGTAVPGGARGRARARSASPTTRRSIVYGRDTEGDANEKWPGRRAGQIAATRALLILRYAGVDDVRLLDGGYDWWVRAGNPLETDRPRADARRGVRRHHPAAAGGHRRHRRGQADPRRPRRRGAGQRPDLARAHRRGQRLQLHRPGGPDQGRRVGQLRHRRLPHAALPQHRQHDARLPGDRGQLGGGRDHARQVGRVLLRHRLAGQRDLVLRVPPGLAAHRGLRRRLVRVEPGPGQQPDRDRGAADAWRRRSGRAGGCDAGRDVVEAREVLAEHARRARAAFAS